VGGMVMQNEKGIDRCMQGFLSCSLSVILGIAGNYGYGYNSGCRHHFLGSI